jgi:hypothetical protein
VIAGDGEGLLPPSSGVPGSQLSTIAAYVGPFGPSPRRDWKLRMSHRSIALAARPDQAG